MSIITAIKPQKNNKRVNIYLDNEFGFGIDLVNFVVLGLKVNQELSTGEVENIIKKAEFQKNLDKLLRFATLRPRSQKEIRDWFKRKEVHESIQKELFNRLKRLELLDDRKFAVWWVEQRNSFRPKSKRVLSNELLLKGIKKETIEEVLLEIKLDETKIAEKELERKAYKWEGLDKKAAKRKKTEYLLRKGFGFNIVEKILNKR